LHHPNILHHKQKYLFDFERLRNRVLKKYIRSAGIGVINNGNFTSSSFTRDERILFGNFTYTPDSKGKQHLTLISRIVEGDLNSDYTVRGLKER
jgi:hypothetical protein